MSEFYNLIAVQESTKTEKKIQPNLVKLLRDEKRVEGIGRRIFS